MERRTVRNSNGDVASFTTGPYFNQGFGIGSNGFAGFTPDIAGVWDQQNYAVYLDFEGDVTEKLVLGFALGSKISIPLVQQQILNSQLFTEQQIM